MWKMLRLVFGMAAFIGLGAAAGAGAAWLATPAPKSFIEGDYSSYQDQTGHQVVLLGTEFCPYCQQARAHLAKRSVAFADIDVENSELGMTWLGQLGSQGVPVLLIGDRQLRGFNPDNIDQAVAALE